MFFTQLVKQIVQAVNAFFLLGALSSSRSSTPPPSKFQRMQQALKTISCALGHLFYFYAQVACLFYNFSIVRILLNSKYLFIIRINIGLILGEVDTAKI